MSRLFEELDRRPTPMGEISLRRRLEPTLQIDVYEAMLGEEHLMSSLFTAAEIALATLALPEAAGDGLHVVVGGLGLGYTAAAALDDPRVASVHVVEALPQVVEWHQRRLLPTAPALIDDPRCHLVEGDFFAMVAGRRPFGPDAPDRLDAILVDIDHTPRHLLHPSHAPFYTAGGLEQLADRLAPGGVFGLWSDDPPDPDFVAVLEDVLTAVQAHIVTFPNHHTGRPASNTVYTAVRPAEGS